MNCCFEKCKNKLLFSRFIYDFLNAIIEFKLNKTIGRKRVEIKCKLKIKKTLHVLLTIQPNFKSIYTKPKQMKFKFPMSIKKK